MTQPLVTSDLDNESLAVLRIKCHDGLKISQYPVRTCKIVSHDGPIGVKYRREGAFHRMKSSNCTITFFCGISVYDTTLSCSTQLPRNSGMEKLEARPTSSRSAFSECILFKPIFARYADCFVVSLVISTPLFPISLHLVLTHRTAGAYFSRYHARR